MSKFKFSVGPWNVHAGADSYGPATRSEISLEEKFKRFAEIGFDAVQFHDDDAVPNINDLTEEEIKAEARRVKGLLDKYGLKAEFVAPRLWMDPHTIDGGFMSSREGGPGVRPVALLPLHRHRPGAGLRPDRAVAGPGGYACAPRARALCGPPVSWWRPSTGCWSTTRPSGCASSPSPTSPSTAPSAAPWAM